MGKLNVDVAATIGPSPVSVFNAFASPADTTDAGETFTPVSGGSGGGGGGGGGRGVCSVGGW